MKYLIVLFALFLVGCNPPPYLKGAEDVQIVGGFEAKYFKDTRTNVCFVKFGDRVDAITYVPCTPEVEILIGK